MSDGENHIARVLVDAEVKTLHDKNFRMVYAETIYVKNPRQLAKKNSTMEMISKVTDFACNFRAQPDQKSLTTLDFLDGFFPSVALVLNTPLKTNSVKVLSWFCNATFSD